MEIYIALICIGGALAVAVIFLFVYLSNNLLKVTKYNFSDERIREEGVRIVHLSDLHGKRFGKGNKRLLKKVENACPDFIVITGDIIHKYRKRDMDAALEAVEKLSKIAPLYYVSGNHEMRRKTYRVFSKELSACGARVLDDECVSVCGVTLCGVNCASIKKGGYFRFTGEDGYKILLAHFPEYLARYSSAGFDLVLSGHAHGGQWRVPFTKLGIYAPGQGLFPKYISGVHYCGNMRQVISRGLGNSQCPLRLFNTPEVVVVELKRK